MPLPRRYIIRTLLYKEYLRYRYNWGVLVVAGALLALSALISIGARMNRLPGQAEEVAITECFLLFQKGTPAEALVQQLVANPPAEGQPIRAQAFVQAGLPPSIPAHAMAIHLLPPAAGTGWTVRYWYVSEDLRGSLPYRDWFSREMQDHLGTTPRLVEESRTDARHHEVQPRMAGTLPEERIPLIITALAIFALYLFSFSLYISSTGEEREKKMLLGLLLTPASPLEVITAKAIFYASASVALALAVVATYKPILLLNPLLWGAVIYGALGYVAIGTILVCLVRRQTTMNTIPMLYLIVTSIIMFLAQFLPIFIPLRLLMIEDWLYRQMQHVIAGQGWSRMILFNQAVLIVLVVAWLAVAVRVFARQGMLIGRAR